MDSVDQVAQITAEPIEFPDKKGVAVSESFQARRELGSIIILLRLGMVLIGVVGFDASDQARIPLEVRTSGHWLMAFGDGGAMLCITWSGHHFRRECEDLARATAGLTVPAVLLPAL